VRKGRHELIITDNGLHILTLCDQFWLTLLSQNQITGNTKSYMFKLFKMYFCIINKYYGIQTYRRATDDTAGGT
jgi:hypothetical protein